MVFKVGDLVKVYIPEDVNAPLEMHDLNTKEFRISRFGRGKGSGGYCELEGVSSEKGVPFVFMNDWLIKVTE